MFWAVAQLICWCGRQFYSFVFTMQYIRTLLTYSMIIHLVLLYYAFHVWYYNFVIHGCREIKKKKKKNSTLTACWSWIYASKSQTFLFSYRTRDGVACYHAPFKVPILPPLCLWTRIITLFPAPPTRTTLSGFMASIQSFTSLLLWDRVVVTMCCPSGTSFSWNPKDPRPRTPQIVLPSTVLSPACNTV